MLCDHVWEIGKWKTIIVLLFYLKTYENHWFWEIGEWKTMTVLLFCLKTYENHWFWEIGEWKTMTVLLCCLNTYENRKPTVLEDRRMENDGCFAFLLEHH